MKTFCEWVFYFIANISQLNKSAQEGALIIANNQKKVWLVFAAFIHTEKMHVVLSMQ